jgi:hypothetical protein
MEAVWAETERGRSALQWTLYGHATAYMRETEAYVRPIVTRVYESSWGLFDNHLYPGAHPDTHTPALLIQHTHTYIHTYMHSLT